jgi:hypothetical protein
MSLNQWGRGAVQRCRLFGEGYTAHRISIREAVDKVGIFRDADITFHTRRAHPWERDILSNVSGKPLLM